MRVQIVTYNLEGISEGDYLDVASQLADRFSALSGLQAKVWLENPESNTYGAVYLWEDEESMQRFLSSDLFEGTNPEFSNIVVQDFGVLENLTRRTQPVVEVLEEAPSVYAPPPLPSRGDEPAPPPPPPPMETVPSSMVGAKKARAKKAAGKKAAAKKAAGKKAVKAAATKRAAGKKAPLKRSPAKKASRARIL